MARHDREESLEEQLAWLDAIKEQEEAPALAVKATTVDDTVISPYPKDPWSLVPAEPDTASSPLFRAAVDSAHPATNSSVTPSVTSSATEPPAEDADAAEWMEASDTVSSFTVPAPASGKQDNDGFLAQLKPLPRQESDDGGLGDFTEPHIRTPFAAPAHEPSRGLFEQPQRQAESSDPAPSPAPTESADPEPATSTSSETQRFSFGSNEFGGTDPGRFSFGGGDQDRAGGTAFSFGSGDFSVESSGSDRPAAEVGGDLSTSATADGGDRFTFGSVETDRFPTGGESAVTPAAKESPRQAPVPPSSHAPDPEHVEPFRAPESFGTDRPEPAVSPERSFGSAASSPSTFSAFSDPSSGREHTEREDFFAPGRESGSPQERTDPFTPGKDAPAAPGREAASAQERMERENPFAPGRDTAEPVREPYQARRRQTASAAAFGTTARQQPPGTAPRQSADSLDPESLLRGRRNAPAGGWRKLVYKASAGLIKPGESPEVRRRRELVGRARTPVATGHHRVAVLSLKGGVGKTTTTVGLGATLAQVRGDRVIAVDANPDRGTLSDKVELETSATVRDLLNERQQIKRYVDIRAFTSQAPSRLEILASDRDPSVSEAFSASDYQSVSQVLENFYSICITDCGTGLLHSAMSGVLGLADQLVLVSSPSVDGARAASATLDWLEAHHYEELVRSATVVLCSVRPRSKSTVDIDRLEAHFAARCRAVIRVPYDTHLEEGAEIELDRLQPATRESYLRLAASVGDGFAGPQP
ncbi:AAA family ATPase [Streptosporangium sp. NBC_01755]|uniref:nucleotide-binding protein n=1 Tax=unclassified Streptosporangium TaxID=2632669 RepID=UPI002DD9B902|nr:MULTISPECIES: AAA family ATPase [unclassified Streptosporangium]WSA25139.1 AAA family ATPase [Streptosporangium sp. NBC_01810]WSD03520.1 AAA family ATPase [Streptosporangium sp. NBC_01755]